jgi:two-component system, OmpR family, response regulator PhoP
MCEESTVRILVIEDDANIRDGLHRQLVRRGHRVNLAIDGEEGLFAGTEYDLDAAIVDLGLPKIPGMEVIRKWRERGRKFPVLVLTARSSWQDKVDGFGAGADDYVTKPFEIEEVLARVHALMRRANGWASPELVCGPVVLDTNRRCVSVCGRPVALSNYEMRVLEHLMLCAGKVISKQELAARMYDEDLEPQSNVIEVHVGQLRRKLDPYDVLRPIETVRGCGYLFTVPRKS